MSYFALPFVNDSTIISEPFLLPYVILTPPKSPAHCLTVGNVTFNVLISLAQNNLTSVLVLWLLSVPIKCLFHFLSWRAHSYPNLVEHNPVLPGWVCPAPSWAHHPPIISLMSACHIFKTLPSPKWLIKVASSARQHHMWGKKECFEPRRWRCPEAVPAAPSTLEPTWSVGNGKQNAPQMVATSGCAPRQLIWDGKLIMATKSLWTLGFWISLHASMQNRPSKVQDLLKDSCLCMWGPAPITVSPRHITTANERRGNVGQSVHTPACTASVPTEWASSWAWGPWAGLPLLKGLHFKSSFASDPESTPYSFGTIAEASRMWCFRTEVGTEIVF